MFACVQCGNEFEDNSQLACTACEGPLIPIRGGGDELIGRAIAGKYILLECLGKGGMGSVYRARTRSLESFVAIKLLALSQSPHRPEALRRFDAEARNSSRLRHPHNVRAFDFGHSEDGLVYIVMELIEGEPLSHIEMPLQSERAVDILTQVCGAVGEAHAIGLIHRDLKPENIMLSQVDGRDFARVVDYGLSKFEDSKTGITGDGRFIGTPEYISPEQLAGLNADRRSDIYALGLVLYKMVTGRAPFESENPLAVAYRHLHEPPPSPRTFVQIAPALDALILECLSKAPEERPQSVDELRARLVGIELSADDAMESTTESAPGRDRPGRATGSTESRIWARRVAAGSVAVGASALIVLVSTWGDRAETTNEDSPSAVLITLEPEPTAGGAAPAQAPTEQPVAGSEARTADAVNSMVAAVADAVEWTGSSLRNAAQLARPSEPAGRPTGGAAELEPTSSSSTDVPARSERERRRPAASSTPEPTAEPAPEPTAEPPRAEPDEVSVTPESESAEPPLDLREALRSHTRDLVRRGGSE